jgi:hypothetical protein
LSNALENRRSVFVVLTLPGVVVSRVIQVDFFFSSFLLIGASKQSQKSRFDFLKKKRAFAGDVLIKKRTYEYHVRTYLSAHRLTPTETEGNPVNEKKRKKRNPRHQPKKKNLSSLRIEIGSPHLTLSRQSVLLSSSFPSSQEKQKERERESARETGESH